MKRIIVIVVLSLIALLSFGCAAKTNNFEQSEKSGAIGAFTQTSPADGALVETASPAFSWTAAENAETYILEIFEDEECTDSVYRKANIAENSFTPSASLALRTEYFWKVTAVNADTQKEADNAGLSFSCQLSAEDAQVDIDLGSPQDYTVNETGMSVTVSLDTENTLGTGTKTLKLSYEENSIGWGIVSRTVGYSMNAGDAVKFTFLYTGGSASFGIRFLEMDSDLWTCDVTATQGAGVVHTAVVPYSAFALREDESFGDHAIQFDLVTRIDFMIEQCYDGGSFYIADISSVNYSDYAEKPVSTVDLGETSNYSVNIGGDTPEFEVVENWMDSGEKALTVNYGKDASAGWSVLTKQVGAQIVSGTDAVRFQFMFTGAAADFMLRFQEGDRDLWTANLSAQNNGILQTVMIPYSDFVLRGDESFGDGTVQMDRLLRIDFTIGNAYAEGTCTFSNIQFVKMSDYEVEEAEMWFDGVFGSNMVLQRDEPVTITGGGVANETYTLQFDGKDYSVTADENGRWQATLPQKSAGGNYTITLSDENDVTVSIENVTFGDVYLFSGQSNMAFKLMQATDPKGDYDNENLRLFFQADNPQDTPQTSPLNAYWSVSNESTALATSAIAWFASDIIQRAESVPVGVLVSAVGGTSIQQWMSEDVVIGDREDRCKLYNGMIAPLLPMNIKGIVWYQASADIAAYEMYGSQLEAFFDDLRDKFESPDLPVYLVQLQAYITDLNWAYMREVQEDFCKSAENVHLIVSMDDGEANDIHPTRKYYIAERVANLIRQYTYGTVSNADMPMYSSYEVVGSEMQITFENGAGLKLEGTGGFDIAGADRIFYTANAEIRDGKLILSSPYVSAPMYASYEFTAMPNTTLYNGAGLPVGSFRTFDSSDDLSVFWRENLIDAQYHDANNREWTVTIDREDPLGAGDALCIAYNNEKGDGWGIVRYHYGSILGFGDTIAFAMRNTKPNVTVNLRIWELDGDCWQTAANLLADGDGNVYLVFNDTNFTRTSESWGDGKIEYGSIISYIDVVIGNCFEAGELYISGMRTIDESEIPVNDPNLVASFDKPYNESLYSTQSGAGTLTLSHSAESAIGAPALKMELDNVQWANVFIPYRTDAYAGNALSFDMLYEGGAAEKVSFVFQFDGYRKYTQTLTLTSGVNHITIWLEDFEKREAGDVDFSANNPSQLTQVGFIFEGMYSTATAYAGEIRFVTQDKPAPVDKELIAKFDGEYDAALYQPQCGEEGTLTLSHSTDSDIGAPALKIEMQGKVGYANAFINYTPSEYAGNALTFDLLYTGGTEAKISFVFQFDGYRKYTQTLTLSAGVNHITIWLDDFEKRDAGDVDFSANTPSQLTQVGLMFENLYSAATAYMGEIRFVTKDKPAPVDKELIAKFDGAFDETLYNTQSGAGTLTLAHNSQSELESPALQISLDKIEWGNVFINFTTSEYAGNAVTFDMVYEGSAAGEVQFVFQFDGYRKYTQTLTLSAGVNHITIWLEDFVKSDANDVDFSANNPSQLTQIGFTFKDMYGVATAYVGEIRFANVEKPVEKTSVIDDFESYDASSWTGTHTENNEHPQMTLTSAEDEKSGGEHGMQLRYVNAGYDTTYMKTLSEPLTGTELSLWLKGQPSSTVFLYIVSDGVTYKKTLSSADGTAVTAEGSVHTYALASFYADGGVQWSGGEIDGFGIMIQDWTQSYGYAMLYVDDIVLS